MPIRRTADPERIRALQERQRQRRRERLRGKGGGRRDSDDEDGNDDDGDDGDDGDDDDEDDERERVTTRRAADAKRPSAGTPPSASSAPKRSSPAPPSAVRHSASSSDLSDEEDERDSDVVGGQRRASGDGVATSRGATRSVERDRERTAEGRAVTRQEGGGNVGADDGHEDDGSDAGSGEGSDYDDDGDQDDEAGEEDEAEFEEEDEEEDSEDEFVPDEDSSKPKKPKAPARKGSKGKSSGPAPGRSASTATHDAKKRRKSLVAGGDGSSIPGKPGARASASKGGVAKVRSPWSMPKGKLVAPSWAEPEAPSEERPAARSQSEVVDERKDGEELQKQRDEAAQLWEDVRARKRQKQAVDSQETPSGARTATQDLGGASADARGEHGEASREERAEASAAPTYSNQQVSQAERKDPTLQTWLGMQQSSSIDYIPMPTTAPEALISDRDSLFVGYVYPLLAASQARVAALLSHLTRVVHPTSVPVSQLPAPLRSVAPSKRGATHDMYAWRVLTLKPGRDGTAGPNDFGLEESFEDDGERGGGRAAMKALRECGATDVLVVVSRWYGGTMLGPIRFQHIETCAREALRRHLMEESLNSLREDLARLDEEVAQLRRQLLLATSDKAGDGKSLDQQTPPTTSSQPVYDGLTVEKAQRLVTARTRTVEALQRRLESLPSRPGEGPKSTPDPT